MTISVNIPKNDYVQPTEVREDVVQMICDVLLHAKRHLVVKEDNKGLYLAIDCRTNKADNIYNDEIPEHLRRFHPNPIRIHGSEVQAAFDALIAAGYFIYGALNITSRYATYDITTKPYFENRPATTTKFSEFID